MGNHTCIWTLLAFLSVFGVNGSFGQDNRLDDEWTLLWSDEFDSLNTDIWMIQNNFDHYGGELQVYTSRPENVFVENGIMTLRVREEEYNCPPAQLHPWGCAREYNSGQPYAYTSGWIESRPEYSMQYGYVEARVRLPYGYGFWPAFWTFVAEGIDHENAAEIDIFEMLGRKPPYIITTNVHMEYCNTSHPDYPDCNIPSYYEEDIIPNYPYRWFRYGLQWSPEKITWLLEDYPFRSMNNPGVVDSVRIILNLAIEAGYPPNAHTPFPSDMQIDYVRVYEKNDSIISGIDQGNLSQNLRLFPNPATGNTLYVQGVNGMLIDRIDIVNSLGQVVLTNENTEGGTGPTDIGELPSGHYFIRAFTNFGEALRPFVRL